MGWRLFRMRVDIWTDLHGRLTDVKDEVKSRQETEYSAARAGMADMGLNGGRDFQGSLSSATPMHAEELLIT